MGLHSDHGILLANTWTSNGGGRGGAHTGWESCDTSLLETIVAFFRLSQASVCTCFGHLSQRLASNGKQGTFHHYQGLRGQTGKKARPLKLLTSPVRGREQPRERETHGYTKETTGVPFLSPSTYHNRVPSENTAQQNRVKPETSCPLARIAEDIPTSNMKSKKPPDGRATFCV